jgi:hypothetical protein
MAFLWFSRRPPVQLARSCGQLRFSALVPPTSPRGHHTPPTEPASQPCASANPHMCRARLGSQQQVATVHHLCSPIPAPPTAPLHPTTTWWCCFYPSSPILHAGAGQGMPAIVSGMFLGHLFCLCRQISANSHTYPATAQTLGLG